MIEEFLKGEWRFREAITDDKLLDLIEVQNVTAKNIKADFFSNTQSGAYRLPNGNTIITSTANSLIFEVNQLL